MRHASPALLLLVLAACTEPSQPTLTRVSNPLQPERAPARVCNAQGGEHGWKLEVTGSGFARTPRVRLEGPTVFTLPAERVTWVGDSALSIEVPTRDSAPAEELPPGDYRLVVRNPDGGEVGLDGALRVVSPPALGGLELLNAWDPRNRQVRLSGSGLRVDEPPTLRLHGTGLPERALPLQELASDTQLTAGFPSNTPAGTYDGTVTNPEGCAATLPGALSVQYPPLGRPVLSPLWGPATRDQPVTLELRSAGIGLSSLFSGMVPEVFLVAPLKSAPSELVDIPLRHVVRRSEFLLEAVIPSCSGTGAPPPTAGASDCPEGIVPGGPYALKIRDVSGITGQVPAAEGFRVLARPPPVIQGISPTLIDTAGLPESTPLVVRGQGFGTAAKAQLLYVGNNRFVCDLPLVSVSETELRAAVPTTLEDCVFDSTLNPSISDRPLTPGLLVVRVQRLDDLAWTDGPLLSVTAPTPTPSVVETGPTAYHLNLGRDGLALTVATDDQGQPFLYALGGELFGARAEVEVMPLDVQGGYKAERCERQGPASRCYARALEQAALSAPRAGLTALTHTVPGDTSYVYVLGGVDASGVAVRTVERAQVLRSADAVQVLSHTVEGGGALAEGTYYYRVAAVLPQAHALNPGGELLPSAPWAATVAWGGAGKVALRWRCIPGAARYRVYRSAQPDTYTLDMSLLDEVEAPASCAEAAPVTYTDAGARTPSGPQMQRPGALGRWARLPGVELTVGRGNAASRLVGDTVYVAGGFCTGGTPGCATPGELASVERARFTPGGPDLGTFAVVGSMLQPRQNFSLALADAVTAPTSFPGTAAEDAWLLAVGGEQAGGLLIRSPVIEVAQVRGASGPLPGLSFTAAGYTATPKRGGWSDVVNHRLFHWGLNSTLVMEAWDVCTANGAPAPCGPDTFTGPLTPQGNLGGLLPGWNGYRAGFVRYHTELHSVGGGSSNLLYRFRF